MKRFYILITTVCAALSGFAQGRVEISGGLITDPRIPLLVSPVFFESDDEAIRDLALRKRAPNLAIGSHPYFRGPTEPGTVLIPGGRVIPVITPVQPGFGTFPLLEVEIERIFVTPLPSPTFRFNDPAHHETMIEQVALDLAVPGGRRFHETSQIGAWAIGELGAPALKGGRSAPTVTVVPEPGTCALLGLAGLAAWFIRRRGR